VDIKKLLKGAQSNWKKASKRVVEDRGATGFVEIPDGRYTERLVSAKVGESDKGRPQIDFGWKIEDGEYEGKTKHNYQGIETEDNLYYLGRDLEKLGYEIPDDLGDLPDILADIEKSKPLGTIALVTKAGSDFQNLYIRKMFDTDEDEEGEDEEPAEDAADEDTDEEAEDTEEAEEEDADEEVDEEEADEDADEDDGEEVSIEEGMRVVAETAKGREPGVIVGILEDEGKVRVKLDSGKTVRLGPEKIEVEPEEVKKPAKTAPAKKAAPAPAKKSAPAPAKKAAPASKKPAKKTRR